VLAAQGEDSVLADEALAELCGRYIQATQKAQCPAKYVMRST
jgi:hypothetical protein